MDVVKAKDGQRAVKLRNSKSNYSPQFDDLLLIRTSGPGVEGTLRLASKLESENFGVTEAGRERAKEERPVSALRRTASLCSNAYRLRPNILPGD